MDDLAVFRDSHPRVAVLPPGMPIRAAGLWEFLPYNDATLAKTAPLPFRKAVAKTRNALLSASSVRDRESALLALRTEYDRHFGSRSKARNEISLFLYTGPTGRGVHRRVFRTYVDADWRYAAHGRGAQAGYLFTGDGFLNKPKRLVALKAALGPNRLSRLLMLQVPHHGSRHSWHAGLAAALAPVWSVFCSNPADGRYKHPHGEVARDFLPYGPVQVDCERPFHTHQNVHYET